MIFKKLILSIVHLPPLHLQHRLQRHHKLRTNAKVRAGSGIHLPVHVHLTASWVLVPIIALNYRTSLATQGKVAVVVVGCQLISASTPPEVASQAMQVQEQVVAVRLFIRLW